MRRIAQLMVLSMTWRHYMKLQGWKLTKSCLLMHLFYSLPGSWHWLLCVVQMRCTKLLTLRGVRNERRNQSTNQRRVQMKLNMLLLLLNRNVYWFLHWKSVPFRVKLYIRHL